MMLAATIYMCLLGKRGLRRVAEVCYHRAHYAAAEISRLPGYELLATGPFFKEFAVRTPQPVRTINRALAEQGIIGGYDLEGEYPHLQNGMLLCVTEMNSKAEIDALVAALKDML
jgi:glycine dehydrogenase subunit 1